MTTLDAMRGIVSLMVLLYHVDDVFVARSAAAPFGGLFHGGARGVDFLFVLSGYVMTRLYLLDGVERRSAAAFLGQRARRLLPAFWIVSLMALAVYLAGFGGADKAAKLEPHRILASLLLLPQDNRPLLNVSWFLVHEALFCLLVALVLVHRRLGFGMIIAWQGTVLAMMLAGHDAGPSEVPNYLNSRSLGLGIGMIFALAQRRMAALSRERGMSFVFVAAAALFAAGVIWEGTGERDTRGVPIPLLDLAAGVMLVAATTLEGAGRWRGPSALAAIGSISYSLFLTHFSVITILVIAIARLDLALGNWAALMCAAVALILGAVFHHRVDMPIQAALRARRAPAPASPSEAPRAPRVGMAQGSATLP
ncbi:acyltransferase [Roseomonas eburnea]|uniref:Acyltransferase n=1 Tax=Neoroseomonas eburnea TaxID=1346889 RepID=A0A9X9X5Q8_9PROT|nr:acyltransferase [Neoroseomonas eburnea]MBR0679044.1 acyltransferase [Neoroseomonas eburnea]